MPLAKLRAALALLLAAASAAAWGGEDPAETLRAGDWAERMRAVHALGARGRGGRSALAAALADPDWQVRLSAVHWLGRGGDEEGLREVLARERCPLVRLSAAHWLGAFAGDEDAPRAGAGTLKGCESWPWPATREFRRGRHWLSRTAEVTRPDASGCRYIHYRRLGRALCPEGTVMRGVGAGPGEVKFVAKEPPPSGVALCCPPSVAEAAPAQAECRLHPIECPSGWAEMEPPGDETARRPSRYRRTRRMQEGDLNWLHCCKLPDAPPPGEESAEGEATAAGKAALAGKAGEEGVASGEETSEEAREPGGGPGARAQGRLVSVDLRLEQLDFLLASVEDLGPPARLSRREEAAPRAGPEALPAAKLPGPEPELEPPARLAGRGTLPEAESPPERSEPEHRASADIPLAERVRPGPALDPPSPRGPRGRLGRPEVPVRGEARVSAPAELMPDAGRPEPAHDPFPALLAALRGTEPLKRARAAEMLAALGAGRPEAVPALLEALSDAHPRVRAAAALALGRSSRGDPAVRALRRALKDRDPDVRYSAAEALGRIGTPAARKAFAGHLRHESALFIRSGRE